MASVQSVNTILSFANGQPDQSGWNFIQQELVATGVSVEDIEDNKSQIIKYVKDLVNDSLPTREAEPRPRWIILRNAQCKQACFSCEPGST